MTITKERIDKLVELQKQIDEIYNDINYDIIMICREIYAAFELNKPTSYSYTINYYDVAVRWTETWKYGGYDAGYFSFPIECLYSEDALKKHIDKIKQEDIIKKRIKEQTDIEYKKQLYEELKNELENK